MTAALVDGYSVLAPTDLPALPPCIHGPTVTVPPATARLSSHNDDEGERHESGRDCARQQLKATIDVDDPDGVKEPQHRDTDGGAEERTGALGPFLRGRVESSEL